MRILILCTGNSCRSQMAQAFLQSFDRDIQVFSAGTQPAERVQPNTVKVMLESGIDIADRSPINSTVYLGESFDYVITVCDSARETCPHFTGNVKQRIHIGFDDPFEATGTAEEVLKEYRRVRDEIHEAFLRFYSEKIKA